MSARTVVLTGSGIIDDGWKPIIDVLSDFSGGNVYNADTANLHLARAVYWARMQCVSNPRPSAKFEAAAAEARRWLALTTDDLAKRIVGYPRPLQGTFDSVVRRLGLEDTGTTYATTNWDSSLAEKVGSARVHYFHGSAASGNLYLPTEMSIEPYQTNEVTLARVSAHAALQRLVRSAERVVIWGLGLSPLDAELATILGAYARDWKRVDIVDPCPHPVVDRLNILAPIFGDLHLWDPNNLEAGPVRR